MLEIKEVFYTYQSRYQTNEVLHGVSCTFLPGKIYAIMGPSGSGKTTLLSLLAGLDLPTKGEILVDGQSLAKLNRDGYRLTKASVIYQAFNLFPLLTAEENVQYPLALQKKPKAEIRAAARDCLGQVGLEEAIYKKRPLMMSGGEQQRVAIARALASGGRILLADEPTGNLDTKNGEAVVKILADLAHVKGYTVIVITHSTSVAKKADKIYQLVDGKIFEE